MAENSKIEWTDSSAAREIAAKLSAAQKRAFRDRAYHRGAAVIIEWYGTNGLAQASFDRMMQRLYLDYHETPLVRPYVHGGWELTPLGLAVRAILEGRE